MIVAVVYGGDSLEREVSLKTGSKVINALKELNIEVLSIEINEPTDFIGLLSRQFDVLFNALHGGTGENGELQSLCEIFSIPYIGSSPLSSALAMNKSQCKKIVQTLGVFVPKEILINKNNYKTALNSLSTFTFPLIIKPNSDGSSNGLSIINRLEDYHLSVEKLLSNNDQLLLEEYVIGRELTVGVWGPILFEKPLPLLEVYTENQLYDFDAKYTVGKSKHIIPPKNITEKIKSQLDDLSVKIHQCIGCSTYSRVDYILSNDNKIFFLEINTLPGLTNTSLFPDALSSMDIQYVDMIKNLIIFGIENYIETHPNYSGNGYLKAEMIKIK